MPTIIGLVGINEDGLLIPLWVIGICVGKWHKKPQESTYLFYDYGGDGFSYEEHPKYECHMPLPHTLLSQE